MPFCKLLWFEWLEYFGIVALSLTQNMLFWFSMRITKSLKCLQLSICFLFYLNIKSATKDSTLTLWQVLEFLVMLYKWHWSVFFKTSGCSGCRLKWKSQTLMFLIALEILLKKIYKWLLDTKPSKYELPIKAFLYCK